MFGNASFRPSIDIGNAPSALEPLVTSLRVTLNAAGGSAEIEIDDNAGTAALPAANAALRIAVGPIGGTAAEVFHGRVARVASSGGESGRRLTISAAADTARGPDGAAAPLVCRTGQNLTGWTLPARSAGAAPPDGGDSSLSLSAEPGLRPGRIVTVAGIRAAVDGAYHVEVVTHRFSVEGGFKTEARVRAIPD